MTASVIPAAWLSDVLPAVAIALAVAMALLWAVSLVIGDVSIVDPAWGAAFVLTAIVAAISGGGDPARRILLAVMIAVWGLRLGIHLARRKLAEPGEDRRYTALRETHSNFALFSLWFVFGLQGALVVFVSLPVQLAAVSHAALSWTIIFGLALYLIGVVFEALGDEQLSRFKAAPESKGKVMDKGLWRYTRHPNYFGDACVWWGIWLVALPAGDTWWTVIGPLAMTWLLVQGSGKAMLEKNIGQRRPEYAEYIRRTSGFLPRPPKR